MGKIIMKVISPFTFAYRKAVDLVSWTIDKSMKIGSGSLKILISSGKSVLGFLQNIFGKISSIIASIKKFLMAAIAKVKKIVQLTIQTIKARRALKS
jgi:hypothetical protein